MHSLIKNHPFHNGNKRTALVSCIIYYDRAGATIEASENDLYSFLTDIAKGELSGTNEKIESEEFFRKIVSWLRGHKHSYTTTVGDTSVNDFLENCKNMGAFVTTRKKGGSHGISYNGKSIRIAMSTKRIGAAVMKRYLSELGMSI